MTKLETILSAALVGVSSLGIVATVLAIKEVKKDQELLDSIQERCGKIKGLLNKAENMEEGEEGAE